MALVNMAVLLDEATAGGYGIGAFNVANMESVLGVIQAAENVGMPVILQVAEIRLRASPIWMIGPMMLTAAKRASVPIAVHLDHGVTFERIQEALSLGFTSVMIDGSHLPLSENIRATGEVVRLAKQVGASVEAEVGSVGRTEDGKAQRAVCADPSDCVRLVEETGVNALAIGIGNAHGVYAKAPSLRFDVLEALQGKLSTPLVLHGGTGLTDDDYRKLIGLGMVKLNIGTAIFETTANATDKDLFCKIENCIAEVSKVAERYIRVFANGKKGIAI